MKKSSFYFDIGSVWDTEFRYDNYRNLSLTPTSFPLEDFSSPSNFRASAGIALQWLSPMGPLTFSFGRPLKSEDGDRTQTFSFNFGTSF